MTALKLCCLEAEDAKKHDYGAAEHVETLHKADKKNASEELADKFQLSTYGQRYRLTSSVKTVSGLAAMILIN